MVQRVETRQNMFALHTLVQSHFFGEPSINSLMSLHALFTPKAAPIPSSQFSGKQALDFTHHDPEAFNPQLLIIAALTSKTTITQVPSDATDATSVPLICLTGVKNSGDRLTGIRIPVASLATFVQSKLKEFSEADQQRYNAAIKNWASARIGDRPLISSDENPLLHLLAEQLNETK